jgi:hypothetical protein
VNPSKPRTKTRKRWELSQREPGLTDEDITRKLPLLHMAKGLSEVSPEFMASRSQGVESHLRFWTQLESLRIQRKKQADGIPEKTPGHGLAMKSTSVSQRRGCDSLPK